MKMEMKQELSCASVSRASQGLDVKILFQVYVGLNIIYFTAYKKKDVKQGKCLCLR